MSNGTLPDRDQYLRPAEAARYLRMKVKTLANWRSKGRGPSYSKLGRGIIYRYSDLDSYVEANLRLKRA